MKKIKTFFYVVKNSLFSPDYYKDVIKTDVKFSTSYYTVLGLMAAAIISIAGTIQTAPKIQNDITDTLMQAKNVFPQDLIITVENEKVSVNRPEPYALEMPEDWKTDADIKNLLIIDKEGTVNDLINQHAYAVINTKNIIINDQTTIHTIPIKEIPNMQLDKAKVGEVTERLVNLTKIIPIIIFLGYFILYLLYFVLVRTFGVLILSVFFSLYGKSKKLELPLIKYMQVAFHIITLPLFLEILGAVLGVVIPLPFWFFTLSLLLGLIVINSLNSEELKTSQSIRQNN